MREYYVAAEEVEWDYAPVHPTSGLGSVFLDGSSDDRIGSKYMKARYTEYEDDSFTAAKPVPAEWEHLGLLGPVLRAQVGDLIRVTFKNLARFPYTMHPHGVFYELNSEGASFPGLDGALGSESAFVAPGETKTYDWYVTERAAPSGGQSSTVWLYHSHAYEVVDTNAGLVGAILVTGKDEEVDSAGKPLDVDREFVLHFSVMNEMSVDNYLEENIQRYTNTSAENVEALMEDEDFEESNLMHAINGRVFNNLPGMEAVLDEKLRVYLVALGSEVDLHSVHFHGMTGISSEGLQRDVFDLMPASTKVVDLTADSPGTWALHCHVNDHIEAGMMTSLTIEEPEAPIDNGGGSGGRGNVWEEDLFVIGLACGVVVMLCCCGCLLKRSKGKSEDLLLEPTTKTNQVISSDENLEV